MTYNEPDYTNTPPPHHPTTDNLRGDMSSVSCDAVKYEDPVVETSAMGPVHSSTFAPLDTGQPPPHLPPRSLG